MAGVPLTSPGGYCWFLGGEVASHEQIRARIADAAAAGADLIKVMVSGGQTTPAGWKLGSRPTCSSSTVIGRPIWSRPGGRTVWDCRGRGRPAVEA